MDKEKNKDYTGKILSKIQNRFRLLDFLAFLDSIKRGSSPKRVGENEPEIL
jgi:hypothetical protein